MYRARKSTVLSALAGITAAMAALAPHARAQDAEVTEQASQDAIRAALHDASQNASGPRPGADASVFSTMDRTSDGSKLGLTMGATLAEGASGTAIRTDLFGQIMGARGMGGYVSLPMSVVTGDVRSEPAIGNAELGGVVALRPSDALSVLVRGGVMLPTASDSFDALVLNIGAGFGRMTDFVSNIPDATLLRLSASPVFRQGVLIARADLGLDVPLAQGSLELDPVVRANAGVGVSSRLFSVAAELATLGIIGDDTAFSHSLGFTARYNGKTAQPGLSVVKPLDDDVDDIVVVMVDVVVPLNR